MNLKSCLLALALSASILTANGQYTDSLLNVLKQHRETDTMYVEALTRLSWVYSYSNPDTTILLAKKASVLAKNINHHKMEAMAIYIIGAANFIKSDFEQAELWFKKSLTYSKKYEYESGIRSAYNGLGALYRTSGKYVQAVDNFLALLKEYSAKDEGTALVLINLGISYRSLKEYDLSIQYIQKGYRILDSLNIHTNNHLAAAQYDIGLAYLGKKNYQQAAIHFRKSLLLNRHDLFKPEIQASLGTALIEMDSLTSAEILIDEGLAAIATIHEPNCRGLVYLNAGNLRLRQNKSEEATRFGKNALAVLKNTEYKESILAVQKLLSQSYALQHDYKKAYEHSQNAIALQDSLLNGEITHKISALVKSYEFSKKQAEIDHLSQEGKIKELELARERSFRYVLIGSLVFVLAGGCFVYYSLRTKTKLTHALQQKYNEIQEQKELIESVNHDLKAQALRAQMNPHFIFNALNSIQFLIVKKDTEAAGKYLLTFSDLMRSLLNNSEKRWVSLEEEVKTLKLYMELESLRFNGELNYEINPLVESYADDQIPPMVIQPFVENAILHGLMEKSGEKNLHISFQKKDDQLLCEITDNGIGRTAAAKTRKVNEKRYESKGIKITEQRLKILNNLTQCDSHIEIADLYDDHQNPSGTKVTVTFQNV